MRQLKKISEKYDSLTTSLTIVNCFREIQKSFVLLSLEGGKVTKGPKMTPTHFFLNKKEGGESLVLKAFSIPIVRFTWTDKWE